MARLILRGFQTYSNWQKASTFNLPTNTF